MIHTVRDVSNSGDFLVYVVNEEDRTHFCHCSISVELYTGHTTGVNFTIERTVKPFQKVLVRRLPKEGMEAYSKTGYIRTRLTTTQNISSSHNYFQLPMKDRLNLKPDLTLKIVNQEIVISTNTLASYVWIHRRQGATYTPLQLAENYFTLAAN